MADRTANNSGAKAKLPPRRARRPLLGARSAVGRRGAVPTRACPCLVSIHNTARASQPDASQVRQSHHRFRTFGGRISRIPLALGSALIGALIPWAVGAYAPAVVQRATGVPVVEIITGIDAASIGPSWRMSVASEMEPSDVPKSVDSCSSLRRWLTQEEQAADVETTWLRVSFRGTRLEPVTVTGVQVLIDAKSQPLTGTEFACPSAGSEENKQVGVVLDENNPVFRNITNEGGFGDPYFRTQTLTLQKDEVITFAVKVSAYKADYRWHLEAGVRSAGTEVTVPIAGTYRTTAMVGSYGKSWDWDWSKNPQRLVPRGTV